MKRLLPFVVLILLLIAAICSVPFLLRPETHRAEITDRLSKLLKQPVVLGSLSMTYWPPVLKVGQVRVMKDTGEPLLEAETLLAPLDWKALFRLKFVATDLQIHRWVLTTSRAPNGSWDLETWLGKASVPSTSASWPLASVKWKDGEIHAVDRYAAVPQELKFGSVEGSWDPKQSVVATRGALTGIGSPVQFSFNGKGQFFSSPQWVGDLELTESPNTGTFHFDHHSGTLDIKGGSPSWSFSNALALAKFYGRGSAASAVSTEKPLMLQNWQLHVVNTLDHTMFEQTATVSGGLSEIKATIVKSPAGPVAHLDVALKDIPVEAVWNVAGVSIPLNGKITGLAKDTELVLSTRKLSTLKGMGYWEIKEARYNVPEISRQKLAKAKTMAYVKKKYPNLGMQGLPLEKLSAHWQAKDGFITVEDGLLVSADWKAAWVGKIDAARQGMDGYLRLQIHEKDSNLASLIPAKYRTQSAYGRLQGSWQEWFLRATTPSKIPSGTQTKLSKALNQK